MANETKKAAASAGGEQKGKAATHLVVRAHVAGFRRAGRAWPAEDVEVSLDELTEDQVSALKDEPMLSVMPVAKG
jgi:hypothetical protein